MATQVGVNITATAVHRKAQSACCGAPLDRVREGAEEFTCRSCKQPTERVHGEPRYIPASGSGVIEVPDGEG